MATQLQIRRDTAADLALVTPVEGEPIYDQTNDRFGIGDGVSTGDTEKLYALMNGDLHKMAPIAATAGGTADALTATLDPAPTAYTTGMTVIVKAASDNTGSATINVNGLGAKTIKKNAGADNLVAGNIKSGGVYILVYDGTNFQISSGIGGGALTRGTPVSPTGVTQVTFSGLPAGLSRITLMYGGISDVSSQLRPSVRLGDSGGIETTGYQSGDGSINKGATVTAGNVVTDRFHLYESSTAAGGTTQGMLVLTHVGSNVWIAMGTAMNLIGATEEILFVSGSKTLSAELDRVQFDNQGATNFDAGSVNILYE